MLTPSLKIRRHKIRERYGAMLESALRAVRRDRIEMRDRRAGRFRQPAGDLGAMAELRIMLHAEQADALMADELRGFGERRLTSGLPSCSGDSAGTRHDRRPWPRRGRASACPAPSDADT